MAFMFWKLYSGKELFMKLNKKLELFTHIVPVPAVGYYASIAMHIFSEKFSLFLIVVTIISTIIAAILMLILGIAIRKKNLKKIFLLNNQKELKYALLKLPQFESLLIAMRWAIGIILAYIFIIIASWFGIHPFPLDFILLLVPFLGIPLFLSIIPLEMSGHFLITENIIRNFIKNTDLKEIELHNENLKINYFIKILFFILSLVGLPVVFLISLMSLTYYFQPSNINPILHLIIITLITLYPIFQTAYYLAKNLNEGIYQIRYSLSALSEENFNVKTNILTYDELGLLAQFTNQIIEKLKNSYESIKTLNENLEQLVEIRTLEIKKTLEEVQKLKYQQDGDYYLISLLIEPFLEKNIKEDIIKLSFSSDYVIKQKKEFEFKNKSKEIGGDFCFLNTIYLNETPYLFFVNADAMGKSIQGAGGLLILNSIIKSAIERNHLHKNEKKFPEIWLKDLFIEMQRIFESFEGAMMISIVFGLADPITNSLYFINAEHPAPVLIRNKKIRFIQEKFFLRKIGTTIYEGNIYIHTIYLQKNDIFVVGSDGKDDIIYNNQLNTDEKLFGKFLEINEFDIHRTFNHIIKNAKLKDDISLLSIRCLKENFLEKNYKKYKELKIKIYNSYKNKDYENTYELAKQYVRNIPLDNKMSFLLSIVCFKLKKLEEAKNRIEQLLLRNPTYPWYLYLAAKIHIELNEKFYADKYIEKALSQNIIPHPLKQKLKALKIMIT